MWIRDYLIPKNIKNCNLGACGEIRSVSDCAQSLTLDERNNIYTYDKLKFNYEQYYWTV